MSIGTDLAETTKNILGKRGILAMEDRVLEELEEPPVLHLRVQGKATQDDEEASRQQILRAGEFADPRFSATKCRLIQGINHIIVR